MRVDQPGKHSAALEVEPEIDLARPRVALAEQRDDLAIIADQQAGEALKLARPVDRQAVGIVEQCIGQRWGGKRQRGEQ